MVRFGEGRSGNSTMILLLGFIVLLLVGGIVAFIVYSKNQNASNQNDPVNVVIPTKEVRFSVLNEAGLLEIANLSVVDMRNASIKWGVRMMNTSTTLLNLPINATYKFYLVGSNFYSDDLSLDVRDQTPLVLNHTVHNYPTDLNVTFVRLSDEKFLISPVANHSLNDPMVCFKWSSGVTYVKMENVIVNTPNRLRYFDKCYQLQNYEVLIKQYSTVGNWISLVVYDNQKVYDESCPLCPPSVIYENLDGSDVGLPDYNITTNI